MKTFPQSRRHKAFVQGLAVVFAIGCGLVFAINWAVDPLWFFAGNRLTGKNFGFDERNAKLNQFLRAHEQYDCLIFGSSRATWMPTDALKPLHCFNLAFSAGQPEEFVAYAQYLRHLGIRPRYLVVGVDGFSFRTQGRDPISIPKHVASQTSPPSALHTYLSVDSLRMSWRTLGGQMNSPGYYDNAFVKVVSDRAPTFHPERTLAAEGLERTDAAERRNYTFDARIAAVYKTLIDVYPEAKSIGYVPPISAWHVADLDDRGLLPGYLDAMYATARHFPVFLDFSIPSPVTMRTDTTYDGSHYLPEHNRSIGMALITGNTDGWGVDLKSTDRTAYGNQYRLALDRFRGTNGLAAPMTHTTISHAN